jgi:aromatic ring-opening dioxygenase catalytic subunit (LigB family)
MANNRTVVANRFFIAAWLLAHATPAVANDAGLELPLGGSWRPMKEHPSVRLAAERISIRLLATEAIIDVTAHYENKRLKTSEISRSDQPQRLGDRSAVGQG